MRKVVRDNGDEGTHLCTDAYYHPLDVDFQHQFVDHAKAYVEGRVHTTHPGELLERSQAWLKGTYICARPKHLHRFLDEQVYRYHTRKMKCGERFAKSLGAVSGKRLTHMR